MLPGMRNGDGLRLCTSLSFGGYNHTLGARNGAIWDAENLSTDHYPVLTPRVPHRRIGVLERPHGLYCRDGVYWVSGTGFYADGVCRGAVEDSDKVFASLGPWIVLFPDKLRYDTRSGVLEPLEAELTLRARIVDERTSESPAAGCALLAEDETEAFADFAVGDAVTVSGTAVPGEHTTAIIREIGPGRLGFDPEAFAESGTETLTLRRSVPELDFIFENENRLWGCRGDTIYCSKPGDPRNWNVFDGLATDAWAAEVGSAGDFTGGCSYLGYPCFFKEDQIYKVYGDRPANFRVMSGAAMGTAAGAGKSLAIAGETLFYLSRAGIVAYSGGSPRSIAGPFGGQRFSDAVGGSDGVKYYVSMRGEDGGWHLFVYDTRCGLWQREDSTRVTGFGWNGALYFLDAGGVLRVRGAGTETLGIREEPVESMAEFGDFTEDASNAPRWGAWKKGLTALQLRLELDEGAALTVELSVDGGPWQTVGTLNPGGKRSVNLPIVPRRADHFRIRLRGRGGWRLYSLARESYGGSKL